MYFTITVLTRRPVSYTHLDVYKRQAQTEAFPYNPGPAVHTPGIGKTANGSSNRPGRNKDSRPAEVPSCEGTPLPQVPVCTAAGQISVSYTHLDVYKRQFLFFSCLYTTLPVPTPKQTYSRFMNVTASLALKLTPDSLKSQPVFFCIDDAGLTRSGLAGKSHTPPLIFIRAIG